MGKLVWFGNGKIVDQGLALCAKARSGGVRDEAGGLLAGTSELGQRRERDRVASQSKVGWSECEGGCVRRGVCRPELNAIRIMSAL